MIYVFDSASLIKLFEMNPKIFRSLWNEFDKLVENQQIISAREAYGEITQRDDRLSGWAKKHKDTIFTPPNPDEALHISVILAIPHFRQLIKQKDMLRNKKVADPFIIARAKYYREYPMLQRDSCVVTEEKYKENGAKIPNVCKHFQIPYMNLDEFMENEGWEF